eukprot:TRINITY_DN43125_c0_g1_i1.p1 TRINITY_DN43125_c0_g1~~TRINITY_DN43125_c0_g1_i1.p1  ORF type:complete len:270 (+),score=70.02 TRINITY_DN43125_c0_g1_i1:29-811(+)
MVDGVVVERPTLPERVEAVMVYEGVRGFAKRCLYLKDHCGRLKKSMEGEGAPVDIAKVEEGVKEIAERCDVQNQNVKVLFTLHPEAPETNASYIYPLLSYYPPQEYYSQGVDARIIEHVRRNPNSKILNMGLKEQLDEAQKAGFYEMLLLNTDGCVTEGSRSNVFLVKDGAVYTAPSEQVLEGITRTRVIALCKSTGVEVVYTPLTIPLITSAEAMFITSTSNGILPIKKLVMHDGEQTKFYDPSDKLLQGLIKQFFTES